MDLKAFKEEVDRAWRVLKIYEAVLNRDADEAQRHIAASWDEVGDYPGFSDDLAEALREDDGEEALQAFILDDSL